MPISKKYDKEFFKVWSHDMAYVLGFLFADGNVIKTNRNTYYISLYTKDLDLIQEVRKVWKSEHKIYKICDRGSVNYKIQIGSKKWFSDLSKLGLFPDKSRRMRLPAYIPKEYLGSLIRGYFDGDGNVWIGSIHKDREKQTIAIQSAFTSCSKLFLSDLHKQLKHLGVIGGHIYSSKTRNYHRLVLSIQDSLKLYAIMYRIPSTLFLKRKKKVFEKFKELRE